MKLNRELFEKSFSVLDELVKKAGKIPLSEVQTLEITITLRRKLREYGRLHVIEKHREAGAARQHTRIGFVKNVETKKKGTVYSTRQALAFLQLLHETIREEYPDLIPAFVEHVARHEVAHTGPKQFTPFDVLKLSKKIEVRDPVTPERGWRRMLLSRDGSPEHLAEHVALRMLLHEKGFGSQTTAGAKELISETVSNGGALYIIMNAADQCSRKEFDLELAEEHEFLPEKLREEIKIRAVRKANEILKLVIAQPEKAMREKEP